MKKAKRWFVVILIVVLVFTVYWKYFNVYSEGNRSGRLQKFSRQGNIFKTYEGELIMSSITSTSNTALASEKFYFSVKSEALADSLFKLEGKNVTVSYSHMRGHLPWNGETDYYVTGIVVVE